MTWRTFLKKIFLQMQRMQDPAYLHTVSMNELYETVYEGKQAVIDGLLYAGTYLFAGAPKVGKSFFMAQLAYHVSTGQKLWKYEVHQGTVCIWLWKMITSGCRNECPECLVWRNG